MKNSIYEDTRTLAQFFKNHGDNTLCENLIDSIDFSSSSTEAIMRIDFYLRNVEIIQDNNDMLLLLNKTKQQIHEELK